MKTFKRLNFLGIIAMLCLWSPTMDAQTLESDSLALVDLYNDCNGTGWDGFDTWLNGPISEWEDVTVDSATQRVTHVEFSGMTLTGTLPASLGNLDKMSGKIQLNRQEGLTGELPAFLWNWVDVTRFQVKFCGFTSIDVTGMENMVNLTEFNSESTPIGGMVPSVIFELPAMEKLYLHDSEYDALPASVTSISGYTRLYLNGNNLTEIPDMSGVTWGDGAKVRFHNNHLDFADLEPNAPLLSDTLVAEFRYSPQNVGGDMTYVYPGNGGSATLTTGISGANNVYTWIRGEDEVVGETDTLELSMFSPEMQSGKYFALVQNTMIPGLDLITPPTYVFESAFAQDSLALVDLYNMNGGADWPGFDTWLNGPLSDWEAVTVDSASQRVTEIVFKDMVLTGELQESLGNLTELSGKIEFRDDTGLTGELPSFLWNWTKVERFQIKFSGYSSINTDGIENMVNLTEFNTEGSPMTGTIPGEILTLPSMVKLYFHDCEFDALPAEITSITGLDRLYLNGNHFTELPDMSSVTWKDGAKVRVQNNGLTFEDLEYNMPLTMDTLVAEFNFSPQANVGEFMTLRPDPGSEVNLNVEVGGTANVYTWIKGEDVVGDADTFNIASYDPMSDAGDYFALVQNTTVTGLDILSNTTTLLGTPQMTDSLALVDLYNECGGAEWTGFDTWLNGPINTWEQVTVDSASGRVTNVGFKDMHLVGELPASLGMLTEMSGKIEFRDDTLLTGTLPSFLWNWTKVDRFQIKFSGYTSIDTEGIENMVNLTEFNTEGSPMTGTIPGSILTLPAMVKLYFHDCEFDALPPEITSITGLDRLYLNGNHITELPDMSGVSWKDGAKVRVQNNALTFEDLEYNMPLTMDTLVAEFNYSPQGNVGETSSLMPAPGSEVNLTVEIGGTANVYTWIKDEEAVGDMATYTIAAFDETVDAGDYYAVVQNTTVTGLDILSNTTTLLGAPMNTDSLALVDLYNDCGGSEWTGFDAWLNGSLDTWEGVTIDSVSRRVTNVLFKDMNLVGELPSSLGTLTEMSGKIEFRDDTLLTGTLPSFLWNWTKVDRFQIKFSGYSAIDTEGIENMVNLTEFNTEGSPMTGMIPGVILTLPSMVKLYFHDCEFDALPAEITSITGLDRLYLNGNHITELPDMSGVVWKDGAKVRVQNNGLTFEDLEYNMPLTMDTLVAEFNYSPQASVGMSETLELSEGDTLRLSADVGGSANVYTWVKGEDMVIDGATEANLQIDSVTVDDSGTYYALIQNTIVTGLDILTAVDSVNVAPTSGIDELPFKGLKVLGNPVNERVLITSDEVISQVSVFSVDGQLLNRQYPISNNVNMDIASYTPGLYLILLQNETKYQIVKIVKE